MDNIYNIKNHIVAFPEIIQYSLLDPNELATYQHKHGLSLFNQRHIRHLWNIGLLQADLIYSKEILELPGLTRLTSDNNQEYYTYYDNRIVPLKEQGWGGVSIIDNEALDKLELELYFHPFRLYVLYHIERVFEYKMNTIQYLLNLNGAKKIFKLHNDGLNRWTGSRDFSKRIHDWNQIVDLAVFVEPWAYKKVFNIVRYYPPDDIESFNKKKEARLEKIKSFIKNTGLDKLEEIRKQICIDIEIWDDNKILHMILRMMRAEMRERLKGQIGGAMLLFSMAEMLRHACEITFAQELKEEDELGFGTWRIGIKKRMYGENRLYDAKRSVKNEFMRHYGLDYGVRARCYVEGDTESGALKDILGVSNGIEIKNLKGKVVEKGISAFRDSLRQDINSQVFSIIIIDNDNKDYVRAIRKAAENDEICGLFLLSNPDFEFGNYNLNELAEIFIEYAKSRHIENVTLDDMKRIVHGSKSGKEFMQKIHESFSDLSDIKKGEEWGKFLMDYALRYPKYVPDKSEEEIERPITEIVDILLQCLSIRYQESRTEYTVSPETGKPIKRQH